jgi:hypothetical protein
MHERYSGHLTSMSDPDCEDSSNAQRTTHRQKKQRSLLSVCRGQRVVHHGMDALEVDVERVSR